MLVQVKGLKKKKSNIAASLFWSGVLFRLPNTFFYQLFPVCSELNLDGPGTH